MGGDTVSLNTGSATASFASADVADGITVTAAGLALGGVDSGNYTLSAQPTTAADITPIPEIELTVTGLTSSGKVYDGNTSATATITSWGTLSGVEGGDTVTLETGSATASFASRTAANGKTVTAAGLTLGGADSDKYVLIAQPTTTANITALGLTVSGLTASDKTYDGNTRSTITSWGSFSGVVGADTVTLNTGSATASFASAAVGSGKTVTAAGLALGGADSANYSLSAQPTTTASITAVGDGYDKSMKIKFTGYTGRTDTLANFPVLVKLSTAHRRLRLQPVPERLGRRSAVHGRVGRRNPVRS